MTKQEISDRIWSTVLRVPVEQVPAARAAEKRRIEARYHDSRRTARVARMRHEYGIDAEDWARLYEAQSGKCPGCNERLQFDATTHIDHDHETGAVRGLLCCGCNTALGHVRDRVATLWRLAKYLQRFAKEQA